MSILKLRCNILLRSISIKMYSVKLIFDKSGPIFKFTSQQTFVLMKTSSRRLDQDEYIRLSQTSSEDIFKTSWSWSIYSSWPYASLQDVFKTPSRRLQGVFKTSSRHLDDVFKTSSKRLQDILKMSSRGLAKVLSGRIIRVNRLPRSRICLGHTTEKFMVSVENLQVWYKFLKF